MPNKPIKFRAYLYVLPLYFPAFYFNTKSNKSGYAESMTCFKNKTYSPIFRFDFTTCFYV